MSMAPRMRAEATRNTAAAARHRMTARQGLRLVLIGLGTSVVPLDSAVNIAFPDITGSFGLPIEMTQWVVICYVLTHASLWLIGGWHVGTSTVAVVAPLVLQGVGLGLFQVAYMDIVMGTLPPQHRGVAGSLAMLTRTFGVVAGATMLTLVFHALGGASPATAGAAAEGFLSAFRATFRLAGIVSAVTGVAAVWLARRRVR